MRFKYESVCTTKLCFLMCSGEGRKRQLNKHNLSQLSVVESSLPDQSEDSEMYA